MHLAVKASKRKFFFVVSCIVLFFTIILCSNFGSADIDVYSTVKIILKKIPLINELIDTNNIDSVKSTIILKIRLPRILAATLVGAGLSVVGTSFQGMFKNPMADPYVLGISSGAALGATIGIILGVTPTIFAFIGSLAVTIIVYGVAKVGNKLPTVNLLLAGISISYFISALISLLMILNREKIEKVILWTMGSVSSAGWRQVVILSITVIIGSIIIYVFSKDLNVILVGEETAKSLGIEVEKVKKVLIIVASFMVAVIVSSSGTIGFVGLIIPHMIRLIIGPDNRRVIPFSAIFGGIFLVLCDTFARTAVEPTELPVGAITALIGAPLFIYLLYKSKRKII
ncbi:FecCD family ABC transporter permease [Clostridium cellulovorans]|uniref:Transport system permease protein n=1 Tax=Clostridium cellulovorans (strain ATCC 35296 / DSM 3052 / OCM 3 / 743B) TaxID=573061 RepID=D9SL06_CLOC7|nr:iron ABC transporter permease [Clostridium cellulovorans]ADL53578.1 transport system permease protein [Clostridium cellulovorans 743B]